MLTAASTFVSSAFVILPWINIEQPYSATTREVWAQEQRVLYVQRQHKMGRSMRGWCAFAFWARHRRLSWRCVSSRLVGVRCLSTCRVRFRDTQRALPSQTIPQPTRCIPRVPQENLVERHEKKLVWNNTSVQPTTVATWTEQQQVG